MQDRITDHAGTLLQDCTLEEKRGMAERASVVQMDAIEVSSK